MRTVDLATDMPSEPLESGPQRPPLSRTIPTAEISHLAAPARNNHPSIKNAVTQEPLRLRLRGMLTTRVGMNNEEIYRSYAEELTRYATGLVGPFDAADVVTDACLKAFSAKSWPDVLNRRAYLYRTVFSVAKDHHRSTLSRRLREMKTAIPEAVNPQDIDVDVLRAIERLSMQQRAVVLLTYWADLKPEIVADRMGITTGAVKSHLARARKRLQEWLR